MRMSFVVEENKGCFVKQILHWLAFDGLFQTLLNIVTTEMCCVMQVFLIVE